MVTALFSGLVLSVDKMMVILIAPLAVMALSVDKKKFTPLKRVVF